MSVEKIKIPGPLECAAVDEQGHRLPATYATEIYDETVGKAQSVINQETPRASYKVVNISSNTNGSETPASGYEIVVIYRNNTNADLTVTVSKTSYATPDGENIPLTVPAGGYCEVSYLNIGGTIFARGC